MGTSLILTLLESRNVAPERYSPRSRPFGLAAPRVPIVSGSIEAVQQGAEQADHPFALAEVGRKPDYAPTLCLLEGKRLRAEDIVWNRRAMDGGGDTPRSGDCHLAAQLRCHKQVMSGGMEFATMDSPAQEEVRDGIAGFRHFGRDQAADVLQRAASEQ